MCLYEALRVLSVSEYTISDTFSFPVIFKENPSDSNAKYVSCDVKSQFNSIVLDERVDLVIDNLCSKEATTLLIKKNNLLNKFCENCTFLTDGRLVKQVDGYPLGGPDSAVFPNTFSVKIELDVVKPLRSKFYKRSVDENIW